MAPFHILPLAASLRNDRKGKNKTAASPFYVTERQVIYFCPTWNIEQTSQWWQLSETKKIHFKRENTINFDSPHLIPGCMLGFTKKNAQTPSQTWRRDEVQGKWSLSRSTPPLLGAGGDELRFLEHRGQPLTCLSRVLRWYKGMGCSSGSGDERGGPSASTDAREEAAQGWPWIRSSSFCYRWARKVSPPSSSQHHI